MLLVEEAVMPEVAPDEAQSQSNHEPSSKCADSPGNSRSSYTRVDVLPEGNELSAELVGRQGPESQQRFASLVCLRFNNGCTQRLGSLCEVVCT